MNDISELVLESSSTIVAVEATFENKAVMASACGRIALTAPLPAANEADVEVALAAKLNEVKTGKKNHNIKMKKKTNLKIILCSELF